MEQHVMKYIQSRQEIIDQLRELLIDVAQMQIEPDLLDPDTPLFASGFGLDSIDAVELLVGVEQMFGLSLEEGKSLSPLYLRTLNTITDLILEKRDAA